MQGMMLFVVGSQTYHSERGSERCSAVQWRGVYGQRGILYLWNRTDTTMKVLQALLSWLNMCGSKRQQGREGVVGSKSSKSASIGSRWSETVQSSMPSPVRICQPREAVEKDIGRDEGGSARYPNQIWRVKEYLSTVIGQTD